MEIPIKHLDDAGDGDQGTGRKPAVDGTDEGRWRQAYERLAADFNNYKRRVENDRAKLEQRMRAEIVQSILPIYDDFLRLADNRDEPDDGIQAVLSNWQRWLQRFDIEPMQPEHADYHHDYHEAVMQVPTDRPDLHGKVVQVIENGYFLNGTVLRHARVAVGRYQGPKEPAMHHQRENPKGEDRS